jgi:hypothetical protein
MFFFCCIFFGIVYSSFTLSSGSSRTSAYFSVIFQGFFLKIIRESQHASHHMNDGRPTSAGRPGVDFPLTVLALGMLADICAPLLLCPEVDLIMVIDLVDENYLKPFYLPCGQVMLKRKSQARHLTFFS